MIDAEWTDGKVGQVSVTSEKGEDCLIWGDWTVTDASGVTLPTDHDEFGRLRFKTEIGGVYRMCAK